MPDFFFDHLDLIPDDLREEAVEQDGRFVIQLVSQLKFEELRDGFEKAQAAFEETTALQASYEEVVGNDLDAFKIQLAALRRTDQQVKDGQLRGTDLIANEIDTRVAGMKADFDKQLHARAQETDLWREKFESARRDLHRSIIDSSVAEAVSNGDTGALRIALEDIQRRARQVFVVDDKNRLIAKDGEATLYGRDGVGSMTPSEWLLKLKDDAPHFFEGADERTVISGDKLFGGLTQTEFRKLSGAEQLRLARSNGH